MQRDLPHLLLAARKNNPAGLSSLPVVFGAEQQLALGAPFDEHYSLYAPEGYAQEAFYLLPPDLMALLIDAPGAFDIEIVDRWMFLYAKSSLDLTKAQTWRLLGEFEGAVAARVAELSARYVDPTEFEDGRAPRSTADFFWSDQYTGLTANSTAKTTTSSTTTSPSAGIHRDSGRGRRKTR